MIKNSAILEIALFHTYVICITLYKRDILQTLLPLFIGLSIIGLMVAYPKWRDFQRSKIKQKPFPKAWRKIIQKRMPYFRKMPTDLQLQLKEHIQVFIEEKEFIGCNGVKVTDDIRVTIAAQACLLLLNRKTDYFPKLKSILVYPRAFVKQQQQQNEDGIHFTHQLALSGESWDIGRVVLSWEDTVHGAMHVEDGHNVVIHEFAHQLDQENGKANGAPILYDGQNYQTWSSVFQAEFEQLKRHASQGAPSVFNYYGATNPAEFFAVASETFFEQASLLHNRHPSIYQQLKELYRVDPIHWS